MKFCKNCQFSKKEFIQTPQGHQPILACSNEECLDPVEGQMLPCELVRREVVFCGIQAKHYKQKEDQKPASPVSLLEIPK